MSALLEHEDGTWEVYMHGKTAIKHPAVDKQTTFDISPSSNEGMKVAFAHYY
jgi:hypothetical protein